MANNATNNQPNIFNVGVSQVSVTPQLVLNTSSLPANVGLLLAVDKQSTITYSVNDQTVTSSLTYSGVTAGDSTSSLVGYSYNIPTQTADALGNVGSLTPVVNNDVLASANQNDNVKYDKYDFSSFPIITVNEQAILSFDEWWSMFSFPQSVTTDFQSQVKSKLQLVYPRQITFNEQDPDYKVIMSLKSAILSRKADYNSVLGILTSFKIGSTFLNPDKVMFSKWIASYPLTGDKVSFSLGSTSQLAAYLIKRTITGTDFEGAFTAMNLYPNTWLAENQDYWQGQWWDLPSNSHVYMKTQPTATQWQSLFQGPFTPNMPDGCSTFGAGLFYMITSDYSQAPMNNLNPYIQRFSGLSLTPDIPQSTALSTLFDPNFYNSSTGAGVANVLSEMQFQYQDTNLNAFLFPVPFAIVNPVMAQLSPTVPKGITEGNWVSLYGQSWTFALLAAQRGLNYGAYWWICGNNAESTYQYNIWYVKQGFQQLGFKLNDSGLGISSDSSTPLYFTDSISLGKVSDYLIIPDQATQVAAVTTHDYRIDFSISKKEITAVIDNPFDAMADKVLTLRDHFNAKVLNDINCKVLNMPNIDSVVSDYSSIVSKVNNVGASLDEPNQTLLYQLLAPIFYGALQLGTYYNMIDDMYNLYPYSAVPSSILLAYEYTNQYLKMDIPYPFDATTTSRLIEWFFLLPSPTSVKADRMQVYTYKPDISVHSFKTSEKKISAYLPHHTIMMDKLHLKHSFDPSIIEVKYAMEALEDIGTTFTLLGQLYTISRSSASMLKGMLSRHNLNSLEDMATSNDPNIQSVYKQFTEYWSNMLHSKSNPVSSQEDKYKHFFFIPDSESHKHALHRARQHISSLTDAIMLGTFKNSDLTQQLGQFALNTTSKHKTVLYSIFGKLGTDLLADNALKLLDHAIEDVVKETTDIAVDVAKVMLNMVMDIVESAATLVSPVSVITRLWTDVTEKVYNSYNNSPDLNSVLYSSAAKPEYQTAWVIQLPVMPQLFNHTSSGWTLSPDLSNVTLISNGGGFVGADSKTSWEPLPPTEFNTANTSLPPKSEYIWYYSDKDQNRFPFYKLVAPVENNKPIRYRFHTSVGDSYLYLMFNSSYQYPSDGSDGTWSLSSNSDPAGGFLGGFYLSVEPVKDDMGIVNPLLTYKRTVETIYQLPKLFNCPGLMDYLGYKDLWQNFIASVGSQAWANTSQHISMGELLAADAGEAAMVAGFTGYAVSDGLSDNITGVIANGLCASADIVDLALYTSKVEAINSEPNIFNFKSQVHQFLIDVMSYIILWNYMMKGGYLEYFKNNSNKLNKISPNLVNEYEKYCATQYDSNEKNRKLDIIMNDHFYPYASNFIKYSTNGLTTAFFPDFGDHLYNIDFLAFTINPDAHYHWLDKQVAYVQGTSEGTLNLMFPIYSPSIVKDFMYFSSALGRIAAGAFIEKKVAKVFASHLKTSKKIAWLMSKVDPFIGKAKKLSKWLNAHAWAKYHRDHNSKSRAKLINAQSTKLENTLTQQTNTLAGDISSLGSKMPSSFWGLH